MKAKEAIKLYKEASFSCDQSLKDEALSKIAHDFLLCFANLSEARHIRTAPGLRSLIIEELDLKWKKFAAAFPEIRPDGFIALIKSKVPTISVILGR